MTCARNDCPVERLRRVLRDIIRENKIATKEFVMPPCTMCAKKVAWRRDADGIEREFHAQ